MKINLFALLLLAASGAAAQGSDPETDLRGNCGNFVKVTTYGDDNREEFCSQNLLIRDLAESVAGLFTDGSSVTLTGLPYAFSGDTLGRSQRLADGQRFAGQTAAAFCTGFLVGQDLLVTAGHCVKDHHPAEIKPPADHAGPCQENPHHPENRRLDQGDYCENIRVAFGFRKELGGHIPKTAPPEDVYKCAAVISHSLGSGPDYALIRLDRPVTGRGPLAINRTNAGLSKDVPLFVIGHPSGIPLKIAGDAAVISSGTDVYVTDGFSTRKWSDNAYSFMANLDTFHGNSGSPVFNLNTMLVEGILVKGDSDFEPHPEQPGKRRITAFPQAAGNPEKGKGVGEVCTKISMPAAKIPVTGRERTILELNRESGNRLYPAMLKRLIRRVLKQRRSQPQIVPIPNHIVPEKRPATDTLFV